MGQQRDTKTSTRAGPLAALRHDINLPDEKAGEPVGMLAPGERSKSALKQRYRDSGTVNPTESRWPNRIFGGDPDDPRWDEYRRRVAAAKKNQKPLGPLAALAADDEPDVAATVNKQTWSVDAQGRRRMESETGPQPAKLKKIEAYRKGPQ